MKSKIYALFTVFTRVCTFSFIFSSLYILIVFGRYSLLNLNYIWGILLISFVSTVGYIPFLSEKELSKVYLILARVIYFILIDASVLFVGYYLQWYMIQEIKTVVGIELSVIASLICIETVSFILDKNKAKSMNEKLKTRNQEQ